MRKATFKVSTRNNGVRLFVPVNKNAKLASKALYGKQHAELDANDMRTVLANGKQPCDWTDLSPIGL